MNPLIPVTREMVEKAIETVSLKPKGSYDELMAYRNNVPILIAWIRMIEQYAIRFTEHPNNNKRWTKEEDEFLIESICEEDPVSLPILASGMGRSETAVQTRISYLVGVKRLSQQVAGKFIGMANGEEFKANLVGTIYKD